MKHKFFFVTVLFLAAYLLSACGGVPQPAGQPPAGQAAAKVQAVEVAFTGLIEAINGNEWTVNGQVLSVDPGVVRDGPFQAGDTVKIEGRVSSDGSLMVSRVEAPSAHRPAGGVPAGADLTDLPQLGNENGNANSNDDNSNDANENSNSNDDNSNDTNGNDNTNDDNANDADDNSNDDDSNNTNDNTNDDGNSNDDDDNSNDDSGNSNDDDNGGNSNEDDNGGNDNEDDDGGNSNED